MTSDPVRTDDGSLTLRHPELGELYHAKEGAWSEAQAKFISPGKLKERLEAGPVRILDVGFGLGLNTLCALETPGSHRLDIHTLDHDEGVWQRALDLRPENQVLSDLAFRGIWKDGSRSVTAMRGDLRDLLADLQPEYDLVFHDPFRPLVNTEAWTLEVFTALNRLLHPQGALLTYSQSRVVRSGLVQAGFRIGETPARPPHRGGTIAVQEAANLEHPLEPPPTGWGPPFRDPDLDRTANEIRSVREAEIRAGQESLS